MLFDIYENDVYDRQIFYHNSLTFLSSKVVHIGHEIQDGKSYNWDGLKRGDEEFLLWQYTIAGRGALIFEGERHDLLPNDAIMLHIPHEHRYYLPKDSDSWEYVFISMRGSECLRLGQELINMNGPVYHFTEKTPALECIEKIFKQVLSDNIDEHAISAYAYSFCMHSLTEIRPSMTEKKNPKAIERATRFGLNHFEEPIGVQDMADEVGLSRFYFSRLFKKHKGMSPVDFIHKLRMEKAVNMLQMGNRPITEIADKCGFQSASYFCRAFIKDFGISPSKFRASR